jgi:hypothetical protein
MGGRRGSVILLVVLLTGGGIWLYAGQPELPGWLQVGFALSTALCLIGATAQEQRPKLKATEAHLNDNGLHFILSGGPKKRPELPAALKPYLRELSDIYIKNRTFIGRGQDDARAIGARINNDYGFEGMQTVCDTLRFEMSSTAARELESAWHGIGEWER